MGNNTSNQLKNKYERGHYQVHKVIDDTNLGSCEIIYFNGFNEPFLQKDLDPSEYNDDIESHSFQNKLNRQCKYICDFYFVTYDNHSPNHYKMVYEYGHSFKRELRKEKYIWYFIRQVVKAGIYLEDNCLHYPYLGKQYIVQKQQKHFKLVNPFCFPDFLKEVIKIYMSPREQISNRRRYSAECIQKNTFQLPFLIISAITGISEFDIKNDLNLLQNELISIENQGFSTHLVEFLYHLLQNRPKKFFDIERFMEGMGIDFKNPSSTKTYPNRNKILEYFVLQSPGISRGAFGNNSQVKSSFKRPSPVSGSKFKMPKSSRKPIKPSSESFYDTDPSLGKALFSVNLEKSY